MKQRGYRQQDAQEFFSCFAARLEEEAEGGREEHSDSGGGGGGKSTEMRSDNVIRSTFQGSLSSRIRCSACNGVSSRSSPFLCLSLNIPSQYQGAMR